MGEISSGELTKVGGTDIHLPAIRGAQDAIFQSLFGPLADEIGRGLAKDYRSSQGEELSPTETDNLRRHADAVRERKDTPPKEPTRKQRKKLFEWIDEASETDPDTSPEDAAKWQAVLSEILGRNDQASLDALKALNTFDIKVIRRMHRFGGQVSEGEAARLQSLGLGEKRSVWRTPLFLPFAFVGLVALFPIVNTSLFDVYVANSDPFLVDELRADYQRLIAIAGMISFSSLICAGLIWVMQSSTVRFTPLGRDVKSKVDQFL